MSDKRFDTGQVRSARHGALPAQAARLALAAALAGLAGCASLAPGGLPPGTPIAQARQVLGGPTGQYPLPDGGTRLEFAYGGLAKQTYMLDFDRSGALVASNQVLTQANLATITSGLSESELRRRFGRPVWVFGINHPRGQVWNYRFADGDCVWYQVTVGAADHRVVDASIGSDPACDGPNNRD